MKSRLAFTLLLVVLGLASLLPYLAALGLTDLRQNTVEFEITFFGAFVLYLAAVALVLRLPPASPHSPFSIRNSSLDIRHVSCAAVILFALLFRLILLPSRPTLSDDMYRYVWDGRVQAHGIGPYRYPPDADQLLPLRSGDQTVWPHINRKEAVTIYPPGAQLAFAGIWRLVGDSVTGFKAAFVLAELLGGVLLLQLLRHFGQPPERLLIYLWSPLLVFEVAHAGHVDGWMLPLLMAAFWARVKERHWLLGICLGAATLVKFLPALLLPALLPPTGDLRSFSWKGLRAPARVLIAFGGVMLLGYLPYLLDGVGVLGYLPKYFDENFNLGLARLLFDLANHYQLPRSMLANAVTFGGLVVLGLVFVLRPTASARAALVRCVWLIGWFTLFTQDLFPWYLLWLLPLLTLLVEPGKWLGFRLAPMSAWLVFSGTIAFAYMFFIHWRVVPWAQAAEYWPLNALLLLSLAPHARPILTSRLIRPEASAHDAPSAQA